MCSLYSSSMVEQHFAANLLCVDLVLHILFNFFKLIYHISLASLAESDSSSFPTIGASYLCKTDHSNGTGVWAKKSSASSVPDRL